MKNFISDYLDPENELETDPDDTQMHREVSPQRSIGSTANVNSNKTLQHSQGNHNF